ncbi:MAG: NAD-glutamate dehydrogenase [Proteobacteria bacterium]|nr:NAD-glutamate dehydrogenase [Pseudomonadota bacterium]
MKQRGSRLLLGIDVGTSGLKALLLSPVGKVRGAVTEAYPLDVPRPGWAQQDPRLWWGACRRAIRRLLQASHTKPREVEGVGLTGQMHGSVFLGAQGQVLTPALLWCDQRTAVECSMITRLVGGRSALLRYTFNLALTGFTAPKVLWVKRHLPQVYRNTTKVLLPKDFIRNFMVSQFLTGEIDSPIIDDDFTAIYYRYLILLKGYPDYQFTNIQNEDFTVVGVGDMSGDVFGNGMLLSKHIKLIGAFNHLHIFVDPDPDPAKSLAERKRLFRLPRSAWTDYDKKLISPGGAIYERSAKSLRLSPEVRALFEVPKDQVTPNELLSYMLKAQVDLMWFGGIGTYIKASSESDLDVGDRANDTIRVNGAEIRCKVLGEGANLGATQLGRIEYALRGGRLNTDSIDNSAGVDCSDHEVNIKILIDSVVAKGRLSAAQRNKLLASMTKEVGSLVLRHNYLQTQAMTMIQAKGSQALDNQTRLMRTLERMGRLDREVEFLPNDETLDEREKAKQGLTRPEIAIVMSYAKIWLYDEILASNLPDDPKLEEDLVQYFPTPLWIKYHREICHHRLSREIIATRVTNSMINRVGGTFIPEFMEKTGKSAPDIARAYIIAREVFKLRDLWDGIEKLDDRVPTAIQTAMILDINHLVAWVTLWFLRNGKPGLDIGRHVKEFQGGITKLSEGLRESLPGHYLRDLKKRAQPYLGKGVPETLGLRISNLVNLYSGCDIVRLANRRRMPVGNAAKTYFAIGTRFHLGRLRGAADKIGSTSHWQNLAVAALTEEIYGHQLTLARQVIDVGGSGNAERAIQAWIEKNRDAVESTDRLFAELWATEINDISMIAVASRSLRAMTDAGPG